MTLSIATSLQTGLPAKARAHIPKDALGQALTPVPIPFAPQAFQSLVAPKASPEARAELSQNGEAASADMTPAMLVPILTGKSLPLDGKALPEKQPEVLTPEAGVTDELASGMSDYAILAPRLIAERISHSKDGEAGKAKAAPVVSNSAVAAPIRQADTEIPLQPLPAKSSIRIAPVEPTDTGPVIPPRTAEQVEATKSKPVSGSVRSTPSPLMEPIEGKSGTAATREASPEPSKPVLLTPTHQTAPQPAASPLMQPSVATDVASAKSVMTAAAPENAAPRNFETVVQSLSAAREAAQPGRAEMHMLHREFGHVNMQFELAGKRLKVALQSGDSGFGPAVQSAIAERAAERNVTAVDNTAQARGEHRHDAQNQNQQQTSHTSLSANLGQSSNRSSGDADATNPEHKPGGNAAQSDGEGSPETGAAARGGSKPSTDSGLYA